MSSSYEKPRISTIPASRVLEMLGPVSGGSGGSIALSEPTRIQLFSDDPLSIRKLTRVLEPEPDLCVCGVVSNLLGALKAIDDEKPDVMIVDLCSRADDELTAVKQIRRHSRDLGLLVLAACEEAAYIERALRAGALGYLTKHDSAKEILIAVRQVRAREIHVGESLSSKLVERLLSITKRRRRRRPPRRKQLPLESKLQGIAHELRQSIEIAEKDLEQLRGALNLGENVDLDRLPDSWDLSRTKETE